MTFYLALIVLIILVIFVILAKKKTEIANFHHRNYTYFDLVFLTIYFTEQFIFLVLYNVNEQFRPLWIGLIVLFVLTTSSLDKFMMNIRQRKSAKDIKKALDDFGGLLNIMEEQEQEIGVLKERNESMMKFIRKKLQ